MLKILKTNIKRHFSSYFVLIIELVILLVVLNFVIAYIRPLLVKSALYNNLGLSNVVCVTAYMDEDELRSEVENLGCRVLWSDKGANFLSNTTSKGESLTAWLLDETYIDEFECSFSTCMSVVPDENYAIIPASLSDSYKIGETYTVYIEDGWKAIAFTVYGVLNSDYMFLPPQEDVSMDVLTDMSTYIPIVARDDLTKSFFNATYEYTLKVNDDADLELVCEELSNVENVMFVMNCKDNWAEQFAINFEEVKIPIILAVVIFLLCLAGLMSNIILKTAQNERENSIYYICGWTKAKCVAVQVITDTATVFIAVILTACMVYFLKDEGVTLVTYGFSILFAVAMFLIAEVPWMFKLTLKNPAKIAERMK